MKTLSLAEFTLSPTLSPPTCKLNWFHDLYCVIYTLFLPTHHIRNINHFPWPIMGIKACSCVCPSAMWHQIKCALFWFPPTHTPSRSYIIFWSPQERNKSSSVKSYTRKVNQQTKGKNVYGCAKTISCQKLREHKQFFLISGLQFKISKDQLWISSSK